AGPSRPVLLRLATDDGAASGPVAQLSTRAKLDRFASDFAFPFSFEDTPDGVVLSLGAAMDFLTRKDYTDNWASEVQEQFCGMEFADWKSLLTDVGFELDPMSGTSRNDWIVEHRLDPVASLHHLDGTPMQWPVTHVLFVARRPLNT
ncbi:class I SAM-dependent methyltransferase, partial [Actinoplanes sp. NPDC051633]